MDRLRVCVIGGTGGIGQAITLKFANMGAQVTVLGLNFKDNDVKNIKNIEIDLSLMSNVKLLVTKMNFDMTKFDIMVLTCGIFASIHREETSEGIERDLATSYLNRYLLLFLSIPKYDSLSAFCHSSVLEMPRIFVMGFPGSGRLGTPDDLNTEKYYSPFDSHLNTFAGNEALVTYFRGNKDFNIYGLNSGMTKTGIRDNYLGTGRLVSRLLESFIGWFYKSPEQYAEVIVPLLIDPCLDGMSGSFYDVFAKQIPPTKGLTTEYANHFIMKSHELLVNKGLL